MPTLISIIFRKGRVDQPRHPFGDTEVDECRNDIVLHSDNFRRIDPDTMPDWQKRDLGFLDGRGPHRSDLDH
jgi:hypothetical protein